MGYVLLYIVSHSHEATECPGKDPKFLKEFASRFSPDNLIAKEIKMEDVFIDQSCMIQTNKDHLCLFVIEADSSSILSDLFAPMEVEIKPMIRWQNFPSRP